MNGPLPIVKQIILCEKMRFDLATKSHVLTRPRVDFLVSKGEAFPIAYPELHLFMQVTASFGVQRFRVRLVDVTDPTISPILIFETLERAIDLGKPFGSYRLRSRDWSVKMTNVHFPKPGRYEIWMMFGGLQQAKVDILIEGEDHD